MARTPPLLLGLDAGTQSAKACIWDFEGRCQARAARPLGVSTPREGWAEQDPAEWWESACGAIAEAVAQVDARRICAVGFAFQRETFALLDASGAATRPGILWLDIRAGNEAGEAARTLGAAAVHTRTGKPIDVTSVVPRMLWLARNEPDALRRARRWTDVGAFLAEKMTGTPATCVAGADTTGLIDARTRWWAPDLLSFSGLDRMRMPGLFEPGSMLGPLTREAAEATGLSAGVPVSAAGGDGQVLAVGLGAGAAAHKGFTLTLGTSIVLGRLRTTFSTSNLYRTLISARPDRQYLLESVIQSGTYILRWFAESFGAGAAGEAEELERQVSAIAPGSDGLITVPHWWGVRFPESQSNARGMTVGWSNRHTRAHFLRSILEGVAFELKTLIDGFRRELPGEAGLRLAVCGGGARSAAWLRILSDTLGATLAVSREPEPSALGAAILGAVAAGRFPDVDSASAALGAAADIMEPEPAAAARYEALFRGSYLPARGAALRLSAGTAPDQL
jgi:xylulokinase